jgi:hypothetical protein
MATGSRTLKLSILADVDQLNKSLKAANGDVENSSNKISDFGKKAGLAFAAAAAAAGAYAVKIGIDGVKAAIEDEKAQVQLANALRNATGATDGQIAATEQYILKTQLATGVTDEKLRPALARLALSTNDITKAQDLLSLAIDISTQSGKPLEAVANSLGKAYDGNTAALGKLGIGLSSAELKAMTFKDVQQKLTDLFGGAAAANAETYAGRIERLKVTFDEAKENIGNKLLPIIEKLVGYVINNVLPALTKFADFFQPISDAISRNKDTFIEFGQFIQKYIVPVLTDVLGGAVKTVGIIAGGVIDVVAKVIRTIESLVSGAITGINAIIKAYNAIPILPNIPTISVPSTSKTYSSISGVLGSSTPIETPAIPTISVPSSSAGVASAVSSASAASINAPSLSDAQINRKLDGSGVAAVNITVNQGIVGDPEAAARTVVDVLNRSYFRGTGGANALVFE